MHKETSNRVGTIAGILEHIDVDTLRARANGDSTAQVLVDEIQALAGSCLSQVETKPAGDFLSRLKEEREDLDRRLTALNSFLTNNPGHPNARHFEMLRKQSTIMSEFLSVLDERLADIEISKRSENVDG
jgi:hypothetical protein